MSLKIEIQKEVIAEFCRKNRISRLMFFGSVTRDDFGPDSDVDILIQFEPDAKVGLIALSGMELELEAIIGRKVDLDTEGFLNPYFRDEVIASAAAVYEQA